MLSACSPYFRAMLRKSKNPHPVTSFEKEPNLGPPSFHFAQVLIMPDNVRFQDLASLVDFMYLGEVSVPHEDLPLFMALAKQFKVPQQFESLVSIFTLRCAAYLTTVRPVRGRLARWAELLQVELEPEPRCTPTFGRGFPPAFRW